MLSRLPIFVTKKPTDSASGRTPLSVTALAISYHWAPVDIWKSVSIDDPTRSKLTAALRPPGPSPAR